ARHAEKIRAHAVVRLLHPLDECLVLLGGMGGGIKVCGLDAKRDVAHVVEEVVIGDVARPEQADAGFVEPALHELPHHGRRLAGRDDDVNPVRAGSRTRCRNGANAGLSKGTRNARGTSPPAAVNVCLKYVSESWPGAKSETTVATVLRPCLAAQSAMITTGAA